MDISKTPIQSDVEVSQDGVLYRFKKIGNDRWKCLDSSFHFFSTTKTRSGLLKDFQFEFYESERRKFLKECNQPV